MIPKRIKRNTTIPAPIPILVPKLEFSCGSPVATIKCN